LIDYVRRAGAALAVFEPEDVDARGRALETQWRTSAADMEARGREVPAYEAIAWPWDTLASWLRTGREISQLTIESSGAPVDHVACQPMLTFHGRIGDWIEELRQARDRGDRTMFIAATAGRADRAIELLGEYEVRARRLEDEEGFLNASVFVTTGE